MDIRHMLEQLAPRALDWAVTAIIAMAILVAGWILAGWASKLVSRLLMRSDKIDPTVRTFTTSFVRYSLLIITLMAVLAKIGVHTASLVALLGAAGLAVGLALQGALSDVAAGVILLVVRPFRVGDAVVLASFEGVVKSVALFTTEVATADNRKIVIPNSKVWGQPIQNLTSYGLRKLEIPLYLEQAQQMASAMEMVLALLTHHELIKSNPAPQVQLDSLADGPLLVARAWVDSAHLGDAKAELLACINDQLAQANITLARRNGARNATL